MTPDTHPADVPARDVLVVDDTPEIRTLLRAALDGDDRFRVVAEAQNGAQAVELAQALQPAVVILDLSMPVMDGLEALPLIKRAAPAAKVVLLSGLDAAQVSVEAERAGADAFVPKGTRIAEIIAVVDRVLTARPVQPRDDVARSSHRDTARPWLFGSADDDPRVRAGRLAMTLFAVAAVCGLATMPALPAGANRSAVAATALTALGAAWQMRRIPWQRLAPGWTIAPAVLGAVLLAFGVGVIGRAFEMYLPFYVMIFVYLGLTQPPRTTAFLAPLVMASVVVGVATSGATSSHVAAVSTVVTGVTVGELLSWFVAQHRRATGTLESMLSRLGVLTAASDLDTIANLVSQLAAQFLEADSVWVLLPEDSDAQELKSRGGTGLFGSATLRAPLADVHPTGTGLPIDVIGTRLGRSLERRFGAVAAYAFPVATSSSETGAVVVAMWQKPTPEPSNTTCQALDLIAREGGAAISRTLVADRLRHDVMTDPLTGLLNRRGLERHLEHLTVGTAIVMLDLDHFKRLNDTLGHYEGDAELRAFGSAIASALRTRDWAARFGGEEFAVALPAADARGAVMLLKRLAKDWRSQGRTTFSAGVVVRLADETAEEAVGRADAALYRAKAAGRQCAAVEGGHGEADRRIVALGPVGGRSGQGSMPQTGGRALVPLEPA